MNADHFKPGDLAWGTVRGRKDVLVALMDPASDYPWANVKSGGAIHKSNVRDLRPAHVLAPDERAVPKGHVALDPEDHATVGRFCVALANAGASFSDANATIVRHALRALAAEQQAAANPVPPEPKHDALVRGARGMLFEWDSDAELWAGSDGGVGTWEGVVRNYGPVAVYRPDARAADQ